MWGEVPVLKRKSSLLILALVLTLILPSFAAFHSAYAVGSFTVTPSSGAPGGQQVEIEGYITGSNPCTVYISLGASIILTGIGTVKLDSFGHFDALVNIPTGAKTPGTYYISIICDNILTAKTPYVVTDET